MGSSDNFCLRWNDFEANISTSFRELRQDSEFFDVTLCCDNGTDVVQAHKVILAACSPLFRRILARQKNLQHPFLYLKGIRLRELTSVLNFMYHGEVNVAQDSLNGFLAVAEELAVKGLTTDSKPSSYEDAPRRKATAKRKTQSTSGLPKRAKVDDEDDEESGPGTAAAAGGGTDPVDVKSIKAEPEVAVATASGSGAGGPDESFTGDDGADNGELYGSGTGGGGAEGDDFDSFGQYGEGEFDDSSSGAPASGTGADGKERGKIDPIHVIDIVDNECGFCDDYRGETRELLDEHMKTKHLMKPVFKPKLIKTLHPCKSCGVPSITKPYEDLSHDEKVRLHIEKIGKCYHCKSCGLKSLKITDVTRHIEVKHVHTWFSCELCDKSFRGQRSLSRHLDSIHGKGRRLKKRRRKK